jgi:ribosomal subunit interface protein
MHPPLELTFRGLSPSESISEYVREKAEKLESAFERITSCRIAIDAPHQHHRGGVPYRVRIDLHVPGHELVAGEHPSNDAAHADVYAAVDDAFHDATRLLRDLKERRRDAKRHPS